MTKATALQALQITKTYDGMPIIDDINIHVDEGELVCLLGVSGIGKTTLFHILSGLELPDKGDVRMFGETATGISGKASYMQQKDLLLPFETIGNNVTLPLRLRGMDKKEAAGKAAALFEEFGLDGCEKKYPSQLSGGMRQRAALLRAYLFSSRLMLLDEPFSALDAVTKQSLHRWFRNIVESHNTSTLFITHDIDEAILLSDRIYIMSGIPGRITHEMIIGQTCGSLDDFSTSYEFLHFKKEILQHING